MSNRLPVRKESDGWLTTIKNKINGILDKWIYGGEKNHSIAVEKDRPIRREFSPLLLGCPPVDVFDKGDDIVVIAELPGFSADEFDVKVEGRKVFLKGERRGETSGQRGNYTYRECHFGSFQRVIALPCEVEASNCEALLKNGLLEVKLPKTEEAKAKRVHVKVT